MNFIRCQVEWIECQIITLKLIELKTNLCFRCYLTFLFYSFSYYYYDIFTHFYKTPLNANSLMYNITDFFRLLLPLNVNFFKSHS